MPEERVCPSGHRLPVGQFQSYIDLTKDLTKESLEDAILFDCPGGKRGHTFSLSRATASGMFTKEEAAKIRSQAEREKETWSVR